MKNPAAQIPLQALFAAGLVSVLLGSGCGQGTPLPPERIDRVEIVSELTQYGLPGASLGPLVVRVLGPKSMDFLGRRGLRPPAPDTLVTFEVEAETEAEEAPPPAAASGSGGGGPPSEARQSGEGSPTGSPTEKPGRTSGPSQPGAESAESASAAGAGSPAGTASASPSAPGPASSPEGGRKKKGSSRKGESAELSAQPTLFLLPADTAAGSREPPESAAGVAAGATKLDVRTDAEGFARVGVRLGVTNGSWSVEARVKKEKVRFRVVSGVEREDGPLEGLVGSKVPIRLSLMQLPDPSSPGKLAPLSDRQIVFSVAGTPVRERSTAELKDKRNVTDRDGLRETELTLGDEPGVYTVVAEVQPKAGDAPLPPIVFNVTAVDWVRTCFLFLSGVLIFVLGVRLLGNGFLLLTSGFLHLPTGPWSRNRYQGYLGGLLSGGIFESSSLVVSYLVSFANGGLLTAAGGLGLVLGANVGGTILAQILAQRVGWLAVPLLAVGILFILVPRRMKLLSWGWVILGGGLVVTGWCLLEDAAVLATYSEQFRQGLRAEGVDYSLPFAHYAPRFFTHLAFAAVLALVLRTSNLVVVLAMLLASHGIILVSTAIPLIIGANLGSSARVFLVSLPKRREARRLALANLVLQVLGVVVFTLLSLPTIHGHSPFAWLLEWVSPGCALGTVPTGAAQHIAMAHTVFNFLTGLPFLFAPRWILRPVDRLFPAEPAGDTVKPFLLDRNLVMVPALALRQATEETVYMTEVCRKTVAEAFDSFRYGDPDLAEQVIRRGEVVSSIHREVSQYLVEVAENQLSERDASQLEVLQTAVSSLVRIGSLGERYRDLTARKIEEKVQATEEVDRDLGEVYDLVMAQFANILPLLRERDPKTEENAVKMVERIAKISTRVESQWRQRVEQSGSQLSPLVVHLQSVIYLEAFGILFRIGAQLAHIAERMRILRPERF